MRTPARPDRARPLGLRVAFLALISACTIVVSPGESAVAAINQASDVTTLRAQADAIADEYFKAMTRSHELDDLIARNQQTVDALEAKAKTARNNARARAVVAYTRAGTRLGAVLDTRNALAAARRVQLIDRVDANDNAVFAQLRQSADSLKDGQRAVRAARDEQAAVLADLAARGAELDGKLADAEARERQVAAEEVAAAAAAATATAAATTTTTRTPTTTTTTTAPKTPPAPPPPNYVGTPGVNPHHDDPFLTCVRLRESSGNYGAVNPAGPYLGAYQFLQATWNGTANHAHRSELVGVPPNVATPYDQDDMAWALYQWQGTGPWGGCQ